MNLAARQFRAAREETTPLYGLLDNPRATAILQKAPDVAVCTSIKGDLPEQDLREAARGSVSGGFPIHSVGLAPVRGKARRFISAPSCSR